MQPLAYSVTRHWSRGGEVAVYDCLILYFTKYSSFSAYVILDIYPTKNELQNIANFDKGLCTKIYIYFRNERATLSEFCPVL